MPDLKRKERYDYVYQDKDIDYVSICKKLKSKLGLNNYQFDVVYKYIYERFSHASARSYMKGVKVKDIVTSQKEAEKIYSVAKNFVEENKVRLNELVID